MGWMFSKLSFFCSHHIENCETATKYALRVFRLRMLAVKNSQKRRPSSGVPWKTAGSVLFLSPWLSDPAGRLWEQAGRRSWVGNRI